MKKEFLFQEFLPVSAKEWKQKIQADLKGAEYNSSVLWNTPETITVKPFYHQDFFNTGASKTPHYPKNWNIAQTLFIDDEKIANTLLSNALKKGAEAVFANADKPFDYKTLFKNNQLSDKKIYFSFTFFNLTFINKLIRFLEQNNIRFYLLIDPINRLAATGNWFLNYKSDFKNLNALIKQYPDTHTISVNTGLYQNAGATITQQLAYALAHVNEYFNSIEINNPTAQPKITFQVAVGSNYFFEIAKIKALRLLFKTLATEYSFPTDCQIVALSSKRNKTLYDYNVNMLRTTTECMSAILGGANTICNLPYDVIYNKSNDFGERISRNQLLILKEESYFDFEKDPTEGAYYIESLTQQLAEKALQIFKEIEQAGGFIKQLLSGKIQQKINQNATKEQERFDAEEIVLIGTNKYINRNEKINTNFELYPFSKFKKRKTLITPILEKRLAEKLEQNRIKTKE